MQSFLCAEEPLISNDEDAQAHEEQPPPLPPRLQSLQPLPLAPNTGGVLSLDMKAAHANGDNIGSDVIITDKPAALSSKDALNNIIVNQHEIVNAEVADSLDNNRPLPPLPTLPQTSELDSDSEDDYDDNDDDDDDDEDEEYETIDDHKLETANGELNTSSSTKPHEDDVNANSEKPTPVEQHNKANGIDLTTRWVAGIYK